MNSTVRIGAGIRAIILLLVGLAVITTASACVMPLMFYAAVGMMALAIIVVPVLFLQEYDLFCPWSFVMLPIALFCTPQAVCMSFSWPSVEMIDSSMLLGRDPEWFYFPSIVFLSGLVSLTVGYFGVPKGTALRFSINRSYSANGTIIVAGCILMLAIAAGLAFIRLTGGFQSERISDKRTTINSVDVARDNDLEQYGYLRQIAKLSSVAFLVLYAGIARSRKQTNFIHSVLLVTAFGAACLIPFYSSSRKDVCWVMINGLGVTWYLRRSRFWSRCIMCGVAGLTVFLLMSALRNSETHEAAEKSLLTESFQSLILNRNGPGFAKTAHIINHVPVPLDFQYGKTFAVWLIAPIPRSMFPGKPMIHTGPIIGTTIFGTHVSGVPPGIIAELYWNFHIPGVVFGMMLLGVSLQIGYQTFRQSSVESAIVVPVYLFAFTPVGFAVLGNSLGYGAVMRFVDFLMIFVVVFASTYGRRYSEAESVAVHGS